MAFFKKVLKKINGKWYPQAVIVGRPATTDEVADELAEISTVSRGDTYAVLKNLGKVLSSFMKEGRTVKLEGIGTFYYTIAAKGKGMDKAEDVTAAHIENVRVRFIPETGRTASGKVSTRSMVSEQIWWEEWKGDDKKKKKP